MVGQIKNFEGSNYFRQRLVLATLSRTTIKIKHIRVKDDEPGIRGNYNVHLSEAMKGLDEHPQQDLAS